MMHGREIKDLGRSINGGIGYFDSSVTRHFSATFAPSRLCVISSEIYALPII
jgi:hypothetical protein